jgi:isopenicillin N synthase-like dioxygenase
MSGRIDLKILERLAWTISRVDDRFSRHRKLTMQSYSHAVHAVGKKLFCLFAMALDLPETYFDDKVGLCTAWYGV